jgi:hypothetical protein
MKKIGFFLLALCAINFSCTKQVPIPVSYNVTNNEQDTTMQDIYLPDTGTLTMPVLVRFLTGSNRDTVALSISGLPANVTVTPTTYAAIPTYTEDFVFTSLSAPLGTFPVTLTSSVTGETPVTQTFHIIILPANSANIFSGGFTTNNVCSATNYPYAVSCFIPDTVGSTNVMYIENFGGYGPEANARVLFNPYNGTVSVPQQTIGNGVRLNGSGTYNQTTLVINYSAITTPEGNPDNCTATIVK